MIHSHSCFYAEKNCAAYIFSIAKLFPFLWENNFVLTLTRRAGHLLINKEACPIPILPVRIPFLNTVANPLLAL